MTKTFKFTCDESGCLTPEDVVRKIGLEDVCKTRSENDPWKFVIDSEEYGHGTIDLWNGNVCLDDGRNFNYFKKELGCYSLPEALEVSTLIFGKDENDNPCAYIEL